MPNVLFVEQKSVWGGGQVALVNLLHEWQRTHASIQPLVVCPREAALAPRVGELGIECVELELGAIEKTRGVAWNLMQRAVPTMQLLEIMRRHSSEVVYANGAFALLASLPAAALARVPTVWVEHNTSLPSDGMLREMIRRADHIVAVSDVIRRQFVTLEPQAADKLMVVHNGVDPAQFCSNPKTRERVRTEFGWGNNEYVLGTVGRLAPEKGMEYFVEAAAQIAVAVPAARFLMVGDGPEREGLEARTQELGIDRIHFTGFRTDVSALLQAMDTVIFPSLTEAFPLAILEAMAAGRAVIATEVGGVGEMIENGTSGLLVPPRDASAIAEAAQRLSADAERRKLFGENARARVEARWTSARQAQQMAAVIEQAAGQAQ